MRTPIIFALRLAAAGLLASTLAISSARAAESANAEKAKTSARLIGETEPEGKDRFGLGDLLPTAWQKRPKVRFNVFTEMTAEGRSRPEPSRGKPLTYFAPPGKYAETGWLVVAGEKPPPWEQLRESMQTALAANGFNPIADELQRPDLLIVFNFGSFSTDFATLAPPEAFPQPFSADELLVWVIKDRTAMQDVIDRARFIGGDRVAREVRQGFVFGNVEELLLGSGGDKLQEILHLAFHTCYFVTATAYDFSGVEQKKKVPLWQTRMTIEAQGVDMREVLKPLIVNTGEYLGRETPEAVIIGKRLNREGRIDVGTPTVAPEGAAVPPETKK
jgi:hypothetical protein